MKKLVGVALLFGFLNTVSATPVNVNTADAASIAAALHGIGLKKAQDIVADRQKNGAFKSLEDLGRVKGVGDKTLAKNKADILFDGAAAAPASPEKAAPASPQAPITSPATAAAQKITDEAKSAVANPLK
jgi:competence protein ComEA